MVDGLTATCTMCGETKPLAEFSKRADRPGVRSHCRVCRAQYNKKWRGGPRNRERQNSARQVRWRRIRLEALTHYGGVCACCGEVDTRLLTFDHIDGDGHLHRAEIGTTPLALWLRSNGYPAGFQVLCWNCNCGRHFNGGICPHQDPEGRIVCAPSELLPDDDTQC